MEINNNTEGVVQDGTTQQPEVALQQPEQQTSANTSYDSTIDNSGYFSYVTPFKEKAIKGAFIKVPGLSTSELNKNASDFRELIQNNELGDSRPEWLQASAKKVFEAGENFISTPLGIHQDMNVDDLDNVVTYGGEALNARKAVFKKTVNVNNNAALFMSMARSMAGMGTNTRIPLWNSGIWITMSVPKEVDVLYTIEKIANDALLIGTDTGKFIGTMHDAVYYNSLVEFILNHYQDSNLKLENREDIVNYILLSDVPSLVCGMISTMYPDGYSVTRSCKNNYVLVEDGKTKCNHTVTGLINPSLMIIKNNKLITPEMIVHMSKRNSSVSVEEVKQYQLVTNPGNKNKVIKVSDNTYNNDYEVTLSIPSLGAYAQCLNIWRSDLENELDRFLEAGDDIDKKREKATKLLNTNYLSYFLSYVKSIKQTQLDTLDVLDTSVLPEDSQYHTIKSYLEMMSSITPIINTFETEIRDYIHNSTVVIVGLPNYVCPSCQELQAVKNGRDYDNIIPIDMLKLFFTLSQIRVS